MRGARRAEGGQDPDTGALVPRGTRLERASDGEWYVHAVSGQGAVKAYRCPGCDHEIRPGAPHVVAWAVHAPVGVWDGGEDRRHWHTPCWVARTRRRPRR